MGAIRSPIYGFVFTGLLAAQSGLPKDILELARLKRDVGASLDVLPNYTCVETIDRYHRKNAHAPFRRIDTLHVEVAVVNHRELYSWPDANHFEDLDLADMVGAGMVSTGSFTSAVRNALTSRFSTIKWHGEEEVRGRQALRWDYTIPYNVSDWTIQIDGRAGRVAEKGSFWADAATLDLLRLESSADGIPPDLPMTSLETTLDYARTRVGSRDLLLPQSVEVLLIRLDGTESLNRIEFSQCREFVVESRLAPGVPANAYTPAPTVTELHLPAGLQLSVRLAAPVDSKTAAVGDRLTAMIDSPVKNHDAVVIPKGAVLRGRLRRLEREPATRPHYLVGLEFGELEFAGHHARFTGEMIGMQPVRGVSPVLSTTKEYQRELGGVGNITVTQIEKEIPVAVPGVSTFFIEGSSFQLPKGLQMTWRTIQLRK